MNIYAKAFWLQKDGNKVTECKDACFPRQKHSERRKRPPLRFAVADGATNAVLSGVWARILASAFVRRRAISLSIAPNELKTLQDKWRKTVDDKVGKIKTPHLAFIEKLKAGAFSTFLGLELIEDNSNGETKGVWYAAAVGDSCLVQIRDDKTIAAFPLEKSESFTSYPPLLSSLPTKQNSAAITTNGIWMCKDKFFMMTDELAIWFFKEKEANRQPWNVLCNIDAQRFQALVTTLRSTEAMANDDVTLVRIDIEG